MAYHGLPAHSSRLIQEWGQNKSWDLLVSSIASVKFYAKSGLTEKPIQKIVQDAPHTGRPPTTDDDKAKALIEVNRRMATPDTAAK
ncbi:hypothetical protein ANCCEY_11278 [Ancylostoma ceylanicum]|uniref:Uncharacterized protein n=1 Tax=Ancylostoma ceylanicum TaxID=53326 RepID=A0A0D6LC04_9BILA|nr:hypothetical protein ANCCEY_11278 [Ancylostoma ceylanicum]